MLKSCQISLLAACIWMQPLSLLADEPERDEKHGYFWYEDISSNKPEKIEQYPKPVMPSPEAMMTMHPAELRKLLKKHLEYSAYTLKPDDVANYYTVQDVVRRKSAAFTAVSGQVMLEHPELNAKSAYPTTTASRNVKKQQHEEIIQTKLNAKRDRYAFGYLTREDCSYCVVMRQTLKHFQDKHHWRVEEFDLGKHPEIAARFNASVTPMLIMIEKGSQRWVPVAVGAEPLSTIEQGAYRAIRMLEGAIRPEQFYTNENMQGGFFDPAKHQGGL
ncbi:MAG: conjugal transfer protein TraF [Gammaproteobacteria bacterium]